MVNTASGIWPRNLSRISSSLPLRHAGRGQFGVVEIAAGALIGAVKQILVRPFEVEGIGQGLAHPRVLKDRPAQIEAKALHAARQLVGDLLLLDQAGAQGRAVIAGRPILRRILDPRIVLPGLERFERDRRVAIIVVADRIEIIAALVDRQIGAPIIGDPAIGDRAAGIDRLDRIGAAAERRDRASSSRNRASTNRPSTTPASAR